MKLEKYSFSKLSTFHQCKFQYYLNYLKRPRVIGEGNAFSEFGSFCHELLERHAKGELEVYELAEEYDNNYIYRVEHEFPSSFVDLGTLYYEDGKRFFENFEGLDDYEILGVEDKFEEEIEIEGQDPYLLTGFIDLLYRDDKGRLVLHDWKSKSKFKSKKEQAKYARQLYLYALHVKRKYGVYPDVMRFYMFRKQTPIDIEFKEKDLEEALKWAEDTIKEIRYCEAFPKNFDDFFCCNLCDFRNICVGFDTEGDEKFNEKT